AWESNRTGPFRIWVRDLPDGAPRQLSPDEPGRDHCCAHLSPDGSRVVYLSIPGGARKYTSPETVGQLRTIRVDGGGDRVLVEGARHYGEHRAALWWSDTELAYIDAAGDTRTIDLASGAGRLVADGPADGEGFLVDPTGRWATASTATFSKVIAGSTEVRGATPVGGCQAWLAADGRFGVWAAGAGGPIDAIDLAPRRTWTILAKRDPRLPADRGYLYFPMLSRDSSLLAFGASNDEHDHFRADYDVFLVELDPETLVPLGAPVRVTDDPGVDRFPDVWRPASARPRPSRSPQPSRPAAPAPAAGWPARTEGLAFLWETATAANRIAPDASSEVLEGRGPVWTDRRGRWALAGGFLEAPSETAERVRDALRATNTVSLEMVVEPASIGPGAGGPLLALGAGPRDRGLLVEQRGDRVELRIRTGESGNAGGRPVELARLPDAAPHHLAFTYSPGRLRVYLDGAPSGEPGWAGDFFRWRRTALRLGAEPGRDDAFRGFLSHVAVFARELSATEVAADAAAALGALSDAAAPPRLEVTAALVGRAPIPTLDEISPYRRALVVERWRVERVRAGEAAEGEIRVARWAWLDGERTAASSLAPGARAELALEPYAEQPQLESVYLAEGEPARGEPLWFDVGLDGAP
ncbi:MAG TPA: LamG-like jellyroll fold domain-containing protein, partial [Thermoanaerobaculia bacterium]|nr:LamG-like jellyroll fold domain-containing protein [Thermoanaerobaculia bacterium]